MRDIRGYICILESGTLPKWREFPRVSHFDTALSGYSGDGMESYSRVATQSVETR